MPNPATIHTLLESDPSITLIEIGHGYEGGFECVIRRRKPIHAIRGGGATSAKAFRAAAITYLGDAGKVTVLGGDR